MKLTETKNTLNNIANRFGDSLHGATSDIRPKEHGYSNGYSYYGYSEEERDYIYNCIVWLSHVVNDGEGPFYFDIINVYIIESDALADLKKIRKEIKDRYNRLAQIKDFYSSTDASKYPLDTVINFYKPIDNLLDHVVNSREVLDFERPDEVKILAKENLDLYFEQFWGKYKWKCIGHLVSFFIYVSVICWLVFNREENTTFYNKYKLFIICVLTLLTVIFNIAFNNYQTFKDAWRLILPPSRSNLKDRLKNEFMKKKPQ